MAKQKGILPIEGTLGNITFFKSKDGYMVREKGGIPASRIASDPSFQRTRENNAEFGRAGKASKLLRTAFRSLLQKSSDSRMTSRMTASMMKVIKMDATNVRGLRNVIDGEAVLLQGFEFNLSGKLSTTLYAPYTPMINRATGICSVELPPYVPLEMIAAPTGTTHYRLLSGAASINFELGSYESKFTESGYIPLSGTATALLELELQLAASNTDPLFLALCVEFLQEVNGIKYPLKNGAFNACSLVLVEGV